MELHRSEASQTPTVTAFQVSAQPTTNPFNEPEARLNSSYAAWQNNKLVCLLEPEQRPTALAEFVHDSFRALVLNPKFSCIGAKAAVTAGNYRTGFYSAMNTPATTAGLARDLCAFADELPTLGDGLATFVASFAAPVPVDEAEWERLLWTQLQSLHKLDSEFHNWDSGVSHDPEDPHFSFSFAERGFFVVGLHPASSRYARRFAWATLVFNPHDQFERLRARDQFSRMQQTIRTREQRLQGSLNANLSDYGEHSDARQYSGRAVEEHWRCPFHAMKNEKAE